MRNIYLIGFMGAGKSTIARELAAQTGAKQIEMDQLIEEQQGMAITEIFAKYGEAHFRDMETELLKSFSREENIVVSCGGGSVLRDENTTIMKESGKIILLTASPETIYERVKDCTDRPILNGNMNVDFIRGLMEKRRERYESVADVTIATDGKSKEEICGEILRQIQV
ncbi:MAG: shikimate kinase [Roseburia sp.]|nr:shikimate kinase [Roseburia sp.]